MEPLVSSKQIHFPSFILGRVVRTTLTFIYFFSVQVNIAATYGGWAVVTGSTDGIGKEYAHAIAKRGMNVVLISRNETKLRAVADEISRSSGVTVKWIVADFTGGRETIAQIELELKKYEVGLLVNNVGVVTEWVPYSTPDPEVIYVVVLVILENYDCFK